MTTNDQGRITSLAPSDDVHTGHSVCICGKDMPICWDTACVVCGRTLCYDCSYTDGKFWYCKEHAPLDARKA